MSNDSGNARTSELSRQTGETSIGMHLNVDGRGQVKAATGVPFLDHMIDALGRHGRFDIELKATGDASMDPHHTVEDAGIVFGQVLKAALGNRQGIERYGHAYAPLDEALARVVIDCSGRPFLEYNVTMPEAVIGTDFAASLVEEFWRSVAMNAGLTVHIDLLRARNSHHAAEAIFKAAAVALRTAVRQTGPVGAVPSTKGVLE
jgi:imidazoleglycerol-phosphate dehydratase